MTVEEILAALQAVIDQANGQPLSEEDVARYEDLERQLKARQASDAIVKRNAAYRTVQAPAVQFGNAAPQDDEVSRAFNEFLRTGHASDMISRAQGEGTGSAGGYLVPEGFRNKIVERLKAFGGVQGGAESIVTADGAPLPWATNDDTSNTGNIVAEGANLGAGADEVFGTKILGAYTYTSNGPNNEPVKVSWELLQDSAFDLEGKLSKDLATRIYRKLAVDLVTGSGSSEPTGLLSTAGGLSGATALSSNSAPTYADLLEIVHAVDPAYRENAKFVFNDKFLKTLRGIVDDNGRPILWNANQSLADPMNGLTVMGFPVIIDQACPDPSGSNHFGYFGDLQETFVVRTVKDVGMVVFRELYAKNRQNGYMAWARFDATVQNTWAGVLLTAHS